MLLSSIIVKIYNAFSIVYFLLRWEKNFCKIGHGGKGGDGYYDGSLIEGGLAHGCTNLQCELGSGSGNDTLGGSTAGGGIIGKLLNVVIGIIFYFYFD